MLHNLQNQFKIVLEWTWTQFWSILYTIHFLKRSYMENPPQSVGNLSHWSTNVCFYVQPVWVIFVFIFFPCYSLIIDFYPSGGIWRKHWSLFLSVQQLFAYLKTVVIAILISFIWLTKSNSSFLSYIVISTELSSVNICPSWHAKHETKHWIPVN